MFLLWADRELVQRQASWDLEAGTHQPPIVVVPRREADCPSLETKHGSPVAISVGVIIIPE